MKPLLEIKNVSHIYQMEGRKSVPALSKVNFGVEKNEIVSIVGPSGCGKTTLINLIAGLDKPTTGEILLNDKIVDGPGADRGVVFQKYTSFPWLSVLDNVAFGLKMLDIDRKKRERLAKKYIKIVGLTGFEGQYPQQLSGGMQQRVALARTLAAKPDILLMDEPFGALDTQTRRFMQDLLLHIWRTMETTILFITHDVDEALLIADRVFMMSARPGSITDSVVVGLERPRSLELEFSRDFVKLKEHIQRVITEEASKTLDASFPKAITQ